MRTHISTNRSATSSFVSRRQYTSAYVGIRQHRTHIYRPSRFHKQIGNLLLCPIFPVRQFLSRVVAHCIRQHPSASVSIRQHTSASVSIRQYTSAYVSIRQHPSVYVSIRQHLSACVSIRQHTSAYVSMHQHTSACVSMRQHTSAYVSMRQHTSAYILALITQLILIPASKAPSTRCVFSIRMLTYADVC
jgi:hypothetical protein